MDYKVFSKEAAKIMDKLRRPKEVPTVDKWSLKSVHRRMYGNGKAPADTSGK
jgi:hypothetical protein